MDKIKRIKNSNYTVISNVFLQEKNLSLKAKGLLAMILALPDDWDFSINGIISITKEGKTSIYSAIEELKELGYCEVEVTRNEKGVIQGNNYKFFENPNVENPNVENPNVENPNVENPNVENQPQQNKDIINNNNKEINKEEKEKNKKENDLFEKCWVEYRRKGSKKKSKEYWNKLTDDEKQIVLPHIKAYVSTRELTYQKDFERYLRDKIFTTIVFQKNMVVYDPTKGTETKYIPETSPLLMWNDYYKCYMYLGYWDGDISDGYTNEDRPNGAKVTLNNGRGVMVWNSETKKWEKK